MGSRARVWGGEEGAGFADKERARGRVKGRHGTRELTARGTRKDSGDGRRVPRRAERKQRGGREGETDEWARARKIKKISLKFKTEMFPSSKIHQIFTGDR